MTYATEYRYIEVEDPQWIRGGLYRRKTLTKKVTVCVMTAKQDDADDLRRLAIFSDRLGISIKWHPDTTPQTFSLTIQAWL